MPFCKTCGRFLLDYEQSKHKCPPAYKVFHEDHMGDIPKIIHAVAAEYAAEEYAKYYDRDDYPLLNGEEIEIVVESPDGERTMFICSGRSEPTYYANEKKISIVK